MDAIYLFVIAAVIASFGITIVVRSTMDKVMETPEKLASLQSRLFIFVALIEVVPLILIVIGFMYLMDSTVNAILPLGVVILSVLVNFISLFVKKNELISHESHVQNSLNTLFMIGTVLMAAIPLVAVVAIMVR
ncbi:MULTISPECIES: hypothetical protein [Sutcliffiella]|uniref:V-ATPase proteolipid subunit C-like domain-containing protein n=1 Tax=Sutcliffiella cohnii TaxID=33932 RepID=A0A223KQ33_9BACI|nr:MULTISPECIES: hypothetical protein [Sutcliffiella]AST91448.1 hypothetical protein BC6307_09225 [Sutcliffiella cohnii]WBL17274.1 hypothetical protein O1A01_11850 [Sutcliffiella sp. NC1]